MTYNDNIYKAVEKLHWLKIGNDNMLEFYLDNHMMQLYRVCEARFELEMIQGWREKGTFWFLNFGTVVHKLIEVYYQNRTNPDFSLVKWVTDDVVKIWYDNDMDAQYKDHPEYKKLGGVQGLCSLLLEYAQYFSTENERLRVIGTELYFGKAKEVPLLDDYVKANEPDFLSYAPFRLYLCGKIDLLIDDGKDICPMDHKTSKDFQGKNPLRTYEIQDGMTGYVYAANSIIKRLLPNSNRACNKILMNFLQVKPDKNPDNRFKRLPLYKTDFQLEDYRLRMIATATAIYDFIKSGRRPTWNTFVCNNYMHNTCAFAPVHRMPDASSQLLALNSLFVQKPIWNPETIDKETTKP